MKQRKNTKKSCLLAIFLAISSCVMSQTLNIDSVYKSEMQKHSLSEIAIADKFQRTSEIMPFANGIILSNFLLSDYVEFKGKQSFIKVLLVDASYNEYLVNETNSLLADSSYAETKASNLTSNKHLRTINKINLLTLNY